ncbi:MAG: MBL fold metallo-hydrolase [Thermodesulfobacteriota bacterium]
MSIQPYAAADLFQWFIERKEILVLDVRNDKDFKRFQVESPYPFDMINVSYYDYMEIEEEAVAKVPRDRPVRIVCAQEGSAKYVAEILEKHGYKDVRYLTGGIKTWGNLLVPRLVHDSDGYQLYQFIRPGKASCNYGLIKDDEIMFFDPSRNVDFYLDFAKEKGCRVTKTFETHLQADYIAGSRMIAEKTGCDFFGNEDDFKGTKTGYRNLTDGEIHNFSSGGPEVKVIFTPGHTPGSTSFLIDNRYMVSGDMVFIDSIGRPDLGGKAIEWAGLLFDSMNLVKQWDDSLQILPGHYLDWQEANQDLVFMLDMGTIKKRNSSIYGIDNPDDFVTFIKDNMRPQPEEYATIRKANANFEQFDEETQETLDLGKNECAATAYAAAQAASQ